MKNSLRKEIDVKVVAQIADDKANTVMGTYINFMIDELKEEAEKL